MNLLDLSPENISLTLNDKEYNMNFSFMSLRELEIIYGSEEEYNKVVNNFFTAPENIKREDLINFLFAGLIQSEMFESLIDKRVLPWRINREGAKQLLSMNLIKKDSAKYTIAIISAWLASSITPEMLEMLDIMSQEPDGDQKKTKVQMLSGVNSTPLQL
jgi:hypothetical protein